jgi:hypothetical protein
MLMDKVHEIEGLELAECVVFPTTAVKAEPHRLWEFVQKGDVFVLDEVTKLFPNGEKTKDVAPEFLALLSEWGHMVDVKGNAISVVLVVQDLTMIGSWARGLVEKTLHHTKLSSVGAAQAFRCDVYAGSRKGPQYPVKMRETMYVGRYRAEITSLYKSHTMSDSATMGANEKTSDARTHSAVLKKWAVMIGIPLGIVAIFIGLHGLGRITDKYKVAPTPAGASAASGAGVAPAAGMPVHLGFVDGAEKMIERPLRYRITGFVLSEAHPERSRAVLRGDGEALPVFVEYARCRQALSGGLVCPYGGWFYTVNGEVAGKSGEAVAAYSSAGGLVGAPAVRQPLPDSNLRGGVPDPSQVVKGRDVQSGDRVGGGAVVTEPGYGPEVLEQDPVSGRVGFNRPSGVIFHGRASVKP